MAKARQSATTTKKKPSWKYYADWMAASEFRYRKDEDGFTECDSATPPTDAEILTQKEWDEQRTAAYIQYFEHPQQEYTLAEVAELSFEKPSIVQVWMVTEGEAANQKGPYTRDEVDRFLLRDRSQWERIEVVSELLIADRSFTITYPWLRVFSHQVPSAAGPFDSNSGIFMMAIDAIHRRSPNALREAFGRFDRDAQAVYGPRIAHYHPALWRATLRAFKEYEGRTYFEFLHQTNKPVESAVAAGKE